MRSTVFLTLITAMNGVTQELPFRLSRAIREVVNKLSKSSEAQPHDIRSIDELGYLSMENKVHLRRGKWRRYSEEMEQRIIASENAE